MSHKKSEFLFSAAIVLFLIWVIWEPQNWPAPARLFPWSLGFSVLALTLIQFVVSGRAVIREIRTGSTQPKDRSASDIGDVSDRHRVGAQSEASIAPMSPPALGHAMPAAEPAGRRFVTICIWIAAFFLGIWLVGFKLGSFFLTIVFMKVTAKEKWPISAAMALGTYLFFWLVFDIGLKLPLDNGFLTDYFSLDSILAF